MCPERVKQYSGKQDDEVWMMEYTYSICSYIKQ